MSRKVKKAVFPVGGLGTRFLPATKAMPKEMLPIIDKPLIQYAVDEALEAGIEEFIFVTGRGKVIIEDYFDYPFELIQTLKNRERKDLVKEIRSELLKPGQIAYTRQQQPLGLGHAVWSARNLVGDEPFAVLLCDDLIDAEVSCLKQLVDVYDDKGGNVVASEIVPDSVVSRYGILDGEQLTDRLMKVSGMVEKPAIEDAPSRMAITGRYILEPEIFSVIEQLEPDVGGEVQLTDALLKMLEFTDCHGVAYYGDRYDCGSKKGFIEATIALAMKHPELSDAMPGILDRHRG
jgi:UTP--glucose-1-phosphate uridylyltransferase